MGTASLAHVELYSPDVETARDHFIETLGMYEVDKEDDDRVFLRAYGDWQSYSLILREADHCGCRHVAWAVEEREDLSRYKERIEASGYDATWIDAGSEPGQGEAVTFEWPASVPEYQELVYDIERGYDVFPEEERDLKNDPTPKPNCGVGVRRIDHVNFDIDNADETTEFMTDVLDFNSYEEVVDESGTTQMAWLSPSALHHALAFADPGEPENVLGHLSYYVDGGQAGELQRAADLLRKSDDVEITAGPGKHGVAQAQYLYYDEPTGNPMEIFAGSFFVLDPQWETIEWGPEDGLDWIAWWGEDFE